METGTAAVYDIFSVIRRRRAWIAAGILVAMAVALGLTARQTPIYTSSSEALVLPVRDPVDPGNYSGFPLMENELRIASSAAVARIAQETLGPDTPLAPISIQNPPETQTLVFVASSPDPGFARATAQAYARAYLEFRRDNLLSNVEAAADGITAIIADLNDQITQAREALEASTSGAEADGIRFQITTLLNRLSEQEQRLSELQLVTNTQVGEILQEASLPIEPSSPNPSRAVALGLVAGLLVGLGLAFLRERLDRRPRNRADVEAAAGASLLGTVPRSGLLKRGETIEAEPRSDAALAYRSVRARLLYEASHSGIEKIMVTSAKQGEGKTTTAINVAYAIAETGTPVLLVAADVRRRTLARYFRAETEADERDGQVGEEHAGAPMSPRVLTSRIFPNLRIVLPDDASSSRPGGLDAGAIRRAMDGSSPSSGLVIVDAPPVLGLPDALELAPQVDTVALVVNARLSTLAEVQDAAEQLRGVGTSVLGVVMTDVAPGEFGNYHHRRYAGYDERPLVVSADGRAINGHEAGPAQERQAEAVDGPPAER